METLSLWNGL